LVLLLVASLAPGDSRAQDDLDLQHSDASKLFRQRIAPLLSDRCVRCHNVHRREGGLSLSTSTNLAAGGDSGLTIDPQHPAASLLIEMISGETPAMPQEDDPLSVEEVAAIEQWIAAGADWPDTVTLEEPAVTDTAWWSLQPLQQPAIPTVASQDALRARNAIDHFVLAKLREKQLHPSPVADRPTLIRRLSYDLTGLPPTPEEIEAFQSDTEPLAYERLVDRLLQSPRYGEHWARHWLDVVHYGDTHGYDKDKLRPNAWPYRDYVIRAFNQDKPYSRFVREQLAGDVLWPETTDGIVATGFIAAGPWDFIGHAELPESKIDGQVARNLDRDDMVSSTMNTFVSMTAQCARCHHHKFDPITQQDYYSLQAVFAGLDRADRPYPIEDSPTGEAATGQVYAGTVHYGEGNFRGTHGLPRPIHLLTRGEVTLPAEAIAPGTVAIIPDVPYRWSDLPAESDEGLRRVELAEWLVHPNNPLTWRSIVNRIWLYHFGRGLVDSPNDFGRMGQLPTHPELLDWLAFQFRDNGQSIKDLHRLICNSATYRQVSSEDVENSQIDAGNAYYWRQNRRALSAESIRDSVLILTGKMDWKMYGPGFQDFVIEHPEHSPHYQYHLHDPDDPATHRRSIYRFLVRSQQQPFMQTLNCADPSQSIAKRDDALTALQALTMLNNPFMVRMSQHFAQRLTVEREGLNAQIALGFYAALGRPATEAELVDLKHYASAHGLANTCRVLLNLNEFVFVD